MKDQERVGSEAASTRDPLRTLLALKQVAAIIRSVRKRAEQTLGARPSAEDDAGAAHD